MKRRRNPQPKLLEYYDLREFDFDTGKPMPLQKGEGATCERCGREHAKVYVVQTVEGTTKSVGSGCCARAFEGWEPSKDEVKAAKKAFRSKREAARIARQEELAAPLVAALDKIVVPEWKLIRESKDGAKLIYGDPAYTSSQVWLDPTDLDRPDDRRERLNAYVSGWLSAAAQRLPLAAVPRGFDEREIRRLAYHTAHALRASEDRRGNWTVRP